jgi:chromosome segregation ATPase
MIVNPSQGQLQERDDEVIIIDLVSSPIRSAKNNVCIILHPDYQQTNLGYLFIQTDATMGRLNHALSALNKKSDEIQALQLDLTLEREKSSKLEDDLKAAKQSACSTTQEVSASSADPAGAMQSELADVRAKWDREREVWEAERCAWKVELASVTAERDRLETDMRGFDEARASWEDERNKVGLQVADGQSDQIKWSEERARLADQVTSLTETCGAFEVERAQWKQERDVVIAERAAWASERESWVLERAASAREDASRDVYREAMELQSAKWEADRVEWASSKEAWEAEREKWSAERAAMIEAREALNADVERLNLSLDAMTRSKALAEKDCDFFRDQYTQASGFVSATRAENVELEQKAAIAEGRARDGVALIKSMCLH